MPVTEPDPPPEAREAVQAALQQFGDMPAAQLHALAGTRPNELESTNPHPVFHVGLSDLARDDVLASAQPTGWRFLLRQGDEVVASAETVTGRDGSEQFSLINSGPYVGATVSALERAAGLPETRDRSYEPRLLQVPALHVTALWLHSERDSDLVVPLAPAPTGIETNRAYDANEFVRTLAERAAQIPELEPEDTRGG
jgi:hypothetical protein